MYQFLNTVGEGLHKNNSKHHQQYTGQSCAKGAQEHTPPSQEHLIPWRYYANGVPGYSSSDMAAAYMIVLMKPKNSTAVLRAVNDPESVKSSMLNAIGLHYSSCLSSQLSLLTQCQSRKLWTGVCVWFTLFYFLLLCCNHFTLHIKFLSTVYVTMLV